MTGLAAMDVAARVERIRGRFDDLGVDALLVTEPVDVRYLTGFTGSAALVLVRRDRLVFVTDGRYRDQSRDELEAAGLEAEIVVESGRGQQEAITAAAGGLGRVGLDAETVTWGQQRRFAERWFPDAELVATSRPVAELRQVKDPGEQDRIAAACAVADEAFAAVAPRLTASPTEAELALDLEYEMRRRGAEGISFDPIVASGPNGAKPHARPTDRRVEPGDLVVIDFGATVEGYCSDMTRTVCVGEPPPERRRIHEVVLEAQEAGRRAVRAGVEAAAVDRACRDVIAEAGWADAFVHSTGHGVGLEVHEDPKVASTSGDTLAAGHVVTVEPGVYLTGTGGVRIEDTVVVTDSGCEILTRTPKTLVLE